MKLIEKIAFLLLPLSILFSSLTFVPNRILILIMLLTVFIRQRFFLKLLKEKLWIPLIVILYLLLIIFGNASLSKEAILFLSIPIYSLIYFGSALSKFLLKKYFILSVCCYSVILLLINLFETVSFGLSKFFEHEHWWNSLLYKNLSSQLDGHPTYISMFIIAAIVMLLDQSFRDKKYFQSFQSILILSLLILVLILLVVKISFLSIIAILITYMVYLLINKQQNFALIVMFSLCIIGFSAYQIPGVRHRLIIDIKSFVSSKSNSSVENNLNERTALWKASSTYIKKHPFIGSSMLGLSSKSSIYPEAKILYPPLEYPKNSHNNFLEFGVRYGVSGAILFSFFLFFMLFLGLKQASFEIIGIWILLCLFSLTESFMFREQGISLVGIIIAIFGIQLYERNI